MDDVRKSVRKFVRQYNEFMPEELHTFLDPPNPPQFAQYKINSWPFILNHREIPFPAIYKWNDINYLRNKMGYDKFVTIAVKPFHLGEVNRERFVLPQVKLYDFRAFTAVRQRYYNPEVYWLHRTDNNFLREFQPLRKDCFDNIPWLAEIFGKAEAQTLWMQDHRVDYSMRRLYKEHFFYDIFGEMRFRLYPPMAEVWMPYTTLHKFQWHRRDILGWWDDEYQWWMNDLQQEIQWIPKCIIPERDALRIYKDTKCYNVGLRPGDCLYVPPLWFVEVFHPHQCIAMEYRYPTPKDVQHSFLHLVRKLCHLVEVPDNKDASTDTQPELKDSLIADTNKALMYKNKYLRS